jgi:hypothetical protein
VNYPFGITVTAAKLNLKLVVIDSESSYCLQEKVDHHVSEGWTYFGPLF